MSRDGEEGVATCTSTIKLIMERSSAGEIEVMMRFYSQPLRRGSLITLTYTTKS